MLKFVFNKIRFLFVIFDKSVIISVIILHIINYLLISTTTDQKNVCKTFQDYYHPYLNDNCFHDPDASLEAPELIRKYSENAEFHEITSQDGYVLTVFRLPRVNPKGVLLLHHSIATSSRIYLWQGNSSIAFSLWHAGYDVWLANHRGTSYSDKHVNMTSSDYRYWNFSFHEMGLYDVSAELEYVSTKTNGSKIIYIGHSLGAAMGLVYSSLKSVEASNYLKSLILVSAPYSLEHMTGYFYLVYRMVPILKRLAQFTHSGSFFLLPLSRSLLLKIYRIATRLFPVSLPLTALFTYTLCGYSPEETDPTFFHYDAAVHVNDFSWKTLFHFGQIIDDDHRFQMYNFGPQKNIEVYGEEIPFAYPIQNISVPTLLISSDKDCIIPMEDAETLYDALPAQVKVYEHVKISGLNHMDLYTGKHGKGIFLNKLLMFLSKM